MCVCVFNFWGLGPLAVKIEQGLDVPLRLAVHRMILSLESEQVISGLVGKPLQSLGWGSPYLPFTSAKVPETSSANTRLEKIIKD